MEEDDDGTCVAKFRGAAQGAKARLVAPRSTLIQPAPVQTGPCDDAAEALERLLARLVRQC